MRNIQAILTVLLIVIIVGVFAYLKKEDGVKPQAPLVQQKEPVRIELKTQDDVHIIGKFYEAQSDFAVILLPMLAHTKESYEMLSPKLAKRGFNVLALDLRGHGESDGDYENMPFYHYPKMVLDVEAAVNWLKAKNPNIKIAIIGASIGANTAIRYAVANSDIKAVVALSPGLDYKGISTQEITKIRAPVLIVASRYDTYSKESSDKLLTLVQEGPRQLKIVEANAHGTDILLRDSSISEFTIQFLQTTF